MIDHTRITSGFDFEVLLGAAFFRMAVHAMFDAGDIQSENEIEDLNRTMVLGRPTDVAILFEPTPFHMDPEDDSEENLQWIPADLAMTMPFAYLIPDEPAMETALTLLLRAEITEHEDAVTGLVNQVDLQVTYAGLDQASWNWLWESFTVLGASAIDGVFREKIQFNLADKIIPNDVQQVAIRKLAAEGEFQACYALYLNLDLKRGPTHETVPAGPYGTPYRKPLPPEEGVLPVVECNPALGQNFLSAGYDVVFAAPPTTYQRLAADQFHAFAEQNEDGIWTWPFKRREKVIGAVRDISISPASAARIRVKVYASVEEVKTEVEIFVKPEIGESGELTFAFDVKEPESDVSFFDALAIFAGALLTIGLAPLTGGLSLGAGGILAGVSLTLLHSVKELLEERGQETIRGLVHDERDSLLAFLSALPGRVSVSESRVDPCFHRHAQVVTAFKEVNVRKDGLSFAGTVGPGSQDIPVWDVKLVDRAREEEPLGVLQGLVYRVPAPEKILHPDLFNRPDPRRPSDFVFAVDNVIERVKNNRLRSFLPLYPARVRLRSGGITEIFFDSGVALAPHEAAELHVNQVLTVVGYDLIRPRDGRPYYRSKPDTWVHNNLASLPIYSSPRAVVVANYFDGFNQDVIAFSNEQVAKWWHWYPNDGGLSMGLVACHALSTFPLIRDLVWAHLGFEPVQQITWETLETAVFDPDWITGDKPRFDQRNLSPEYSRTLQDWLAQLSVRDLEKVGYSELYGQELTTERLLLNLVTYLYGRLERMKAIKAQYMETHAPPVP